MSTHREQLLQLLGQGIEASEAIKLTGCTQEELGLLLKDKEFTTELRGKRAGYRREIIEDNLSALELNTVKSIKKEMENDGMVSMAEKLRILETVNKINVSNRLPANHYQNPTAHLTIEVKVPQNAISQGITIDQSTGQIIAVGERNMSAMPITGVRKIFAELEAADKAKTQEQKVREVVEQDLEDTYINEDEHHASEGAAANDYTAKEQAASFA